MKKTGLNEIREKYLSFFESKGHLRLPSFPLVPQNDASLLLINAGMAPLKPYFLGKEVPPHNRVTTCQKCIRTPDIERVGKTARHGTFFEMLGNFSFGDYFKAEATAWAWEFITQVMEMPMDRLWITIYEDDDEAFDIWTKNVGVPPDRIVRMGKEDNFWEIGTGPCGPCSEIFFDRGIEHGCKSDDCAVGCDCDRFVEFWNLVFTQFDKDENGNYNRLAKPNIDTGMGLERIAAIMQDVNNLFEVDTITNIMKEIVKVAGIKYGDDERKDVSLRVITDHIRSTTFMICDSVFPSNEGRGYVLRRLLRRAARHGKLLGIEKPFLYNIADTVINESKGAYPELLEKRDYIKKIIKTEEESFDATIDTGLLMLSNYISQLKKEGKSILDGATTFKLYDTYGFPIDLTIEILEENNMSVDCEGFEKEMNAQKERARKARNIGEDAAWSEDVFAKLDKAMKTEFIGYNKYECRGKVTALIVDGSITESANENAIAAIILDKTVFYGESGGQTGDIGKLENSNMSAEVTECKKLPDGKIVHFVNIIKGTLSVGDELTLKVNSEKRRATERNHSATHLLQKALRAVLGDHVTQSGSFVSPDRLRFDFSHFEALTPSQIREVEQIVNKAIFASLPVTKTEMSRQDALKMGAMALFGEKYGETVRVVKMGDFSTELCGGCHVNNTSEIGLFKLISESSAAAGIRRIEGITGTTVLEYIYETELKVSGTADILKANTSELEAKAQAFMDSFKDLQRENSKLREKLAGNQFDSILSNIRNISGIDVVSARIDGFGVDELRNMGDRFKEKTKCGYILLASLKDDKITFVSMATPEAVSKGVHAGNIVREAAKITGGGGGGKPDSAQAGGRLPEKIDEALSVVEEIIKATVK